ncbi:hypothetical protein NC651_003163 [Populus alba x Populus x berolinensis]|nr:hypothetical protein NC651_003163 [Populus alba x Populus x berolinensis]
MLNFVCPVVEPLACDAAEDGVSVRESTSWFQLGCRSLEEKQTLKVLTFNWHISAVFHKFNNFFLGRNNPGWVGQNFMRRLRLCFLLWLSINLSKHAK